MEWYEFLDLIVVKLMIPLLILQLFFNDSGIKLFLIIKGFKDKKNNFFKNSFNFSTIYDILKTDILFI